MFPHERALQAVRPLRLVVWGVIICVLDLKVNDFDILNDAVGATMVAVGALRLSRIPVDNRYCGLVRVAVWVAALSAAGKVCGHARLNLGVLAGTAGTALGICQLGAMLLFCSAMIRLCEAARLGPAARSWRTSLVLFALIYVLPLGVFYLAGLLMALSGRPLSINLGPQYLPVLAVFLVPLIHALISARRLRRCAEAAAANVGLPFDERICPNCGYPLRGLPEPRCPECGTQVTEEVPPESRPVPRTRSCAWLLILVLVADCGAALLNRALLHKLGGTCSSSLMGSPARMDRVTDALDALLRRRGLAPTTPRSGSSAAGQTTYVGSLGGRESVTLTVQRQAGGSSFDQLLVEWVWSVDGYRWDVERAQARLAEFRAAVCAILDEPAPKNAGQGTLKPAESSRSSAAKPARSRTARPSKRARDRSRAE